MSTKITTGWPVITRDIVGITKPAVEWKTFPRSFYQVTAEVAGIADAVGVPGTPATPATYRGWVSPIDLNDPGAIDAAIEEGYILMDILGHAFTVIALNEGGSIDVSDDLLCGYGPLSGRPAIVYNATATIIHPKPPTPTPPVVNIQWFEENLSCVTSGGDNTGVQIGTSREKTLNPVTGLWVNTGNETPISRTNLTACPLPAPDPYRAGQYTGMTFTPAGVTDFSFSFGAEASLTTIPLAGRNSLFLSLPVGKTFKVVDGSGVNITSKFSDISTTDNVSGYQNNKVWKKSPPYSSEDEVPFYVTINN